MAEEPFFGASGAAWVWPAARKGQVLANLDPTTYQAAVDWRFRQATYSADLGKVDDTVVPSSDQLLRHRLWSRSYGALYTRYAEKPAGSAWYAFWTFSVRSAAVKPTCERVSRTFRRACGAYAHPI